MRTVVFDLDGTLADTGADLVAAANVCFRGLGHGDMLHPVDDKFTAMRGGKAMLKLGFERLYGAADQAAIDAQYPVLLEAYAENVCEHTKMFPGAADAVEALNQAGYKTAICTNKPEAMAEDLMQKLGVRGLFAALIGADTMPERKPHPLPYQEAVLRAGGEIETSLLVGDTETDHNTARAVGVPSVLVSFGPEGQGVTRMNPDAVLHHYDDLQNVVRGLIG